MKMMLGNMNQGSDWISSQNLFGLCGKSKILLVLAFIVASAAILTAGDGEGENRISQGQIPPPGKYPSLARLNQIGDSGNFSFKCVASILDRNWLVTSAACLADFAGPFSVDEFRVVVGDEILNETEPYEREHQVERVIFHQRFENGEANRNLQTGDDIAVIKVTPPIQFSNRVSPANMPTCKETVTGGEMGLVAGYGTYQKGGARYKNHRLMEITNKIITQEECSRRLRRQVDARLFCVEATNNISTCYADSAVPFYLVKSDAQMVQIGMLLTWPQSTWCGLGDGNISTFTNLSSYVGWIHRRTSGCGNHPWWNLTEHQEPNNGR